MIEKTFFDLQRFADDETDGATGDGIANNEGGVLTTTAAVATANERGTLVAGETGFYWKEVGDGVIRTFVGGHNLMGADDTYIGTEENPAKLNTNGYGYDGIPYSTTVPIPPLYLDGNLNGTRDGYTVAIDGSENGWEISLKGGSNIFRVDGNDSYGLKGEAVITVKNTTDKINEFNDILNGQQVYIKAATQDTPVTVQAANYSNAITYTFDAAAQPNGITDSVRIGVDNNDTAIFKGQAVDVTLGTNANSNDVTIGTFAFVDSGNDDEATVTSNGNTLNIAVKELKGDPNRSTGVIVTDKKTALFDKWQFDNNSTRTVNNLTIEEVKDEGSGENHGWKVTEVAPDVIGANKSASVQTAGLDTPVIVNGAAWKYIVGDIDSTRNDSVLFDGSGNATIRNVPTDLNANKKIGDVLVKGAADSKAQFDTITADGVVVNAIDEKLNGGATITAATLQTFDVNDDDLLRLSTDTTNLTDPQTNKTDVNPLITSGNATYTYPSLNNPINVNVTGNFAPRNNIEVVLDDPNTGGIKSIEVNKSDEDAPIKVAGDKQFDVIADRKTFNVTTDASDVTFAVRDVVVLSPDDLYDQEDLRTKNSTLNDSVEVSQDWTDLKKYTTTGDPRRDITNVTDKNYNVGIRDKDYAIKDALVVRINPDEENQNYTVTGGDAVFDIEDITRAADATFTINGAAVTLYNNDTVDNDDYIVTASSLTAGVDTVTGLRANDAVSVSGDADGYTAIFQPATVAQVAADETVTFAVNGATVSVKARFVDEHAVTVIADSGNNVTVQGIKAYEEGDSPVVTVDSGATYHFKNDLDRNMVTLAAGATAEVTLNANGDVAVNGTVVDVIEDNAAPRTTADNEKWQKFAELGKSSITSPTDYDTVVSNHAQVYEDFYNLSNSNVSSNTVAGYENQDDKEPSEGESNINIKGTNVKGEAAAIGEAAHVTLSGGSEIGNVPINIQANESASLKDVTISLTNSSLPSSIAVGTSGSVSVSHNIQLSSKNGSYAYLGQYATGENVIQAGGAAMIRHDGTSRATLLGGTGIDTIRGAVNDIVSGGAGGDFFYDLSGYAMDYDVTQGDVIIASRLRDLSEVNLSNIRGTGNQIGFGNGENLLTLGSKTPIETIHMKVAVMDDSGNVKDGVRDVVLANGNVLVDATAASLNGALVISNATRGDGVHVVVGSAGADTMHVGSNDSVNGMGGNDSIEIDANSFGVEVYLSEGRDSVSNWHFGFDRAEGATKLVANGEVRGRMYEDRLLISLEGSAYEMSFEDTRVLGNTDAKTMHGQFDVLVNDKKYTAIRNGDSGTGYAEVTRNDDIADFYLAEREGDLRFTQGVTEDLGLIQLGSDKYQYIRQLGLYNNSKAVVYGTSERETVRFADSVYGGGQAILGANKDVSLGGGNDVIFSGGDGYGIAGNTFRFGTGDGRDTIHSFAHYLGVNIDPDRQECDTIVLESYNGVKAEVDADGYTRVEFALGGAPIENEYVCVYEAPGTFDYDNKMYHVHINDVAVDGMAKIGYSTTDNPTHSANLFTYDKEVSFYIGSSGEARDTLKVKNISENVEIRMDKPGTFNEDGTYNTFYRGIGVVDASEETNTNISIAGSAADNMLIAGNEGTRNFLWGGAGDNTLIGGTGNDYFLYYKNSNSYTAGADPEADGNHDVIVNYNENQDFIILTDVTIDDINFEAMAQAGGNYGITEKAVTVCFNNGGSLTVDVTNQEKVQFYMGDGKGGAAVYSALRSTGGWTREA